MYYLSSQFEQFYGSWLSLVEKKLKVKRFIWRGCEGVKESNAHLASWVQGCPQPVGLRLHSLQSQYEQFFGSRSSLKMIIIKIKEDERRVIKERGRERVRVEANLAFLDTHYLQLVGLLSLYSQFECFLGSHLSLLGSRIRRSYAIM